MTDMSRRTRVVAALVAALAVLACVLVWWLLREEGEGPVMASEPPTTAPTFPVSEPAPARRERCARNARLPFSPEQISIDGLVEGAAVIPVPRDSRGVTGVLPESNKADFAWDRDGIRPGSHRGNVLLNTHTWSDGSALGNRLLDDLDEGDRIVVEGLAGSRLCYRVSKRIEVVAADGYAPYYAEDGPHRLAFIVCSGTRGADGSWSHRTIWFARPAARAS